MGRLENKVALVTGAARGIGEATARLFAKEGATVIIADVDDMIGSAVAKSISGTCEYRHLDATDPVHWDSLMDEILGRHGRLDVLVNNAGISPAASIAEATLEHWRLVNRVNTDSVFLGCKTAVMAMMASNGGSIVNISSITAIRAGANLAAYSASKASVRLLTKSVALYGGAHGIRCNSVHPGGVETRMLSAFLEHAPDIEAATKRMRNAYPLGRWGQPDDIAKAILFLASDDASWITGAELVVDGGSTL